MENKPFFRNRKGNSALLYLILLIIIGQMKFFLLKIGGLILIITIPAVIILLILSIIKFYDLFKEYIKNGYKRNIRATIRIIIIFIMLISLPIVFLRTNNNFLQSRVQMKATRLSTMSFSELYFRENKSYEFFNFGWYGYMSHSKGNWIMVKDTLFIDSQVSLPLLLGNKNLIKNDKLYGIHGDSICPTLFHITQLNLECQQNSTKNNKND